MLNTLFTDTDVLSFFNGSESQLLDHLVVQFTTGWTWIPLYLSLIYAVMRGHENMRQRFLVVGCAALCVAVTALVSDGVLKPLVGRVRPCYDPCVMCGLDLVDGYLPQGYSFPSSHAANTMAVALFVSLLMRDRLLTVALLTWSLANCWTRLYLGVHYPTDVLVGLLLGAMGAVVFYRLWRKWGERGSYSRRDIYIVLSVLVLTLCFVIGRALSTTY